MIIKYSDHAQDEAMLKECFSIDAAQVLKFVREHYQPDDVFEERDLHLWALDNGYPILEAA